MKKTWGEIKSEITSLGFEEETVYNENPKIFIESVNRAMLLIATIVRPIIKRHKIVQNPLPNLLANPLEMFDIQQHLNSDISFTAQGIKAYYFECDGVGTAEIKSETGEILLTIPLSSNVGFKAYKGFADGNVTLTFKGDYAYNIRNIALYGNTFNNTLDGIPPYTNYNRYDIAELTKENNLVRFLDFAYDKPVQQGNFFDGTRYKKVGDYQIEERKIIVLNYFDKGQFEVFYNVAPLEITETTLDEYEIELDYDVTPLIPLLAAHYIWLDDEERKALIYWNEFDDLKNQIIGKTKEKTQNIEIQNTTGWWD